MMAKIFGVLLIILVLLLGGIFFRAAQQSKMITSAPSPLVSGSVKTPTPLATPTVSPTPNVSSSPSILPSPSPIVKTRNVSIDVDNDGAGMTVFRAPRGMRVKLTLNVMSVNVDPLGLEFRSGVLNTGRIMPGMSKTTEFIADQPFTLTPHAGSTGIARPYTIQFMLE